MTTHSSQPEIRSPRVAQTINKALRDKGIIGIDLIRHIQNLPKSYVGSRAKNNLYKIIQGKAYAGEAEPGVKEKKDSSTLNAIAHFLDLDIDEMTTLLHRDKIGDKQWAQSIPRADKVTLEVATVMEGLGSKEREEILMFTKMKAGLL